MSKRKLPTSYSSLRRQIKSQVEADINEIYSNVDCGDCNDAVENKCTNVCDTAESYFVRENSDDCDSVDMYNYERVENYAVSSPSTLQLENDFDDCNWVSSDSDDETDHDVACDVISKQLCGWANKYSIKQNALDSLLGILKPHFPCLPSAARTLLKTPRNSEVKLLENGGVYCHFGLSKGLMELVKTCNVSDTTCLQLQFNIDGVPLFRSSNLCIWPILCMLKLLCCTKPFVVGVYAGTEKPTNATEFLADFVHEAVDLIKNGITIGERVFTVKIHSFVCDAPARAFVKGIKSHSGYAACEKCSERGEYVGKVILPGTTAPLRTDVAFDEMVDEDHHSEPCPLKPLPIGYVSTFGLDYMHLVCLGVVRRLILYWKGPIGPIHVRLGSRMVDELSRRLLSLCPHIPCEFARRPRSVADALRWKATEFREFLLYTGPVVLKNVLSQSLYDHFMLLSVAIAILVSPKFAFKFCDYANELLLLFVREAEKLYGREIYVYNVHCLIHLANDVRNLGVLDDFSAFPYENCLGKLKKMIRKPQFPLQQLVNRLSEQHVAEYDMGADKFSEVPLVKREHHDGPLLPAYYSYNQYRWLHTNKYRLSLSVGNNCVVLKDGSVVLVRNIVESNGDIVVMCNKFEKTEDAFSYPLPSCKLGILKVSRERAKLFAVPVCDISAKCVLLPIDERCCDFVSFPLLH